MAPKTRQRRERAPRSGWGLGGWLLGAFLICWAFVLGVLVGQGSLATPEQLAWFKQVSGLERWLGEDAAPQTQRLKDPQLSFPTRVESQRQMPVPTPRPKDRPPPAAKPAEQPQPRPEASPAAKRDQQAKPAPKTVAAPLAAQNDKPDRQAPVAAPRRFTVQVASFADQEQALNLVRRLQDKGLPAYMQPGEIRGVGRRYRVRVGTYQDMDSAQGVASRLRLQYKLAAYVTRHD